MSSIEPTNPDALPSSETLVADETTPPRERATDIERGTTIGRYVVLSRLGSGGMGVVYAAYDPELDRKIAIKLLHRGSVADEATAGTIRLVREAQAMARLHHPNVLTVHDVGTFEGRVFLAMAFVEGETLRAFMERKGHGWRDVARIFAAAGRGLLAAHDAGIVHRDFKPDNVLLGRDGGVYVADFGLARPTGDEDSTDHDTSRLGIEMQSSISAATVRSSKLTMTGALVGTPAYMAPEQHLGKATDARSDQFSFCVALYEALYDERPYDGDTLASLAFQVTQGAVREPPHDAGVPVHLRRLVMRGLRADPNRRFPDMRALLAELEQRPSSRRRLAAVGLAASFLVGLPVAWYAFTGAEAKPCSGADEALAAAWNDKRKAGVGRAFDSTGVVYASTTWDVVQRELDRYAASWAAMYRDACAATRIRGEQSEELLDRRMACLSRARNDFGSLVDVFMQADAAIVGRSIKAVAELPRLERCADLEALLAVVAPPDVETAGTVESIRDRLSQARALRRAGKYKEALAVAIPAAEGSNGIDYPPIKAEAWLLVGDLRGALADEPGAIEALNRAITAALAGKHDEYAIRALNEMVSVTNESEQPVERVHEWAGMARALIERLGGDAELESNLLTNESFVHRRAGDLEASFAASQRALALRESVFPADHPKVVGAVANLAGAYMAKGDAKSAHEHARRAYEIWSKLLGDDHPDTITALNNLAANAWMRGDMAAAAAGFEKVVAARLRTFGPDHRSTADAFSNRASVLMQIGRYADAEQQLRQALAVYERTDGPDSVNVAEARANLAGALERSGRADEAYDLAVQASEILIAARGAEHPRMATMYVILGGMERRRGRAQRSYELLSKAKAIEEKVMGVDSPELWGTLEELAETELAYGRKREALEHARRALELAEKAEVEAARKGEARFTLALALWENGERSEAVQIAELARDELARGGRAQSDVGQRIAAWLGRHGG